MKKYSVYLIVAAMAIFLALPSLAAARNYTGAEIREGLSRTKSPAERAAWWKANMSFTRQKISGRVVGVSRFAHQMLIDIGSGIKVSCILTSEELDLASKLQPNTPIWCQGMIGSSWTEIFGLSFYIDTTQEKR